MLLKFNVSGQRYEVSLVNGMTIDQLIERLTVIKVPLSPSVRRNLDECNGWCHTLTSQIRIALRDHEWLKVVNACVHGTATLAE